MNATRVGWKCFLQRKATGEIVVVRFLMVMVKLKEKSVSFQNGLALETISATLVSIACSVRSDYLSLPGDQAVQRLILSHHLERKRVKEQGFPPQ